MDKYTYHIIKSIKRGWCVRKEAASRSLRNFVGKEEATQYALSLKDLYVLFIHNEDGTVSDRIKGER